jgi:hypothetical protein
MGPRLDAAVASRDGRNSCGMVSARWQLASALRKPWIEGCVPVWMANLSPGRFSARGRVSLPGSVAPGSAPGEEGECDSNSREHRREGEREAHPERDLDR